MVDRKPGLQVSSTEVVMQIDGRTRLLKVRGGCYIKAGFIQYLKATAVFCTLRSQPVQHLLLLTMVTGSIGFFSPMAAAGKQLRLSSPAIAMHAQKPLHRPVRLPGIQDPELRE